jgi:Uma2 family endonuclease
MVTSLEEFRRWALSDDFPDRGRFDYIAGRIEVDMSPEDLFAHGTIKVRTAGVIDRRVEEHQSGYVFSDRTRISCPAANLSAEPDILFISYSLLASGRARLMPKASRRLGRFVEVEGAADLIVEILSDRSVHKDTVHLPVAYYQAGVEEFWLIDARGEELIFHIHRRGATSFEPVAVDEHGFQQSTVLGCRYRFERFRDAIGNWVYRLREEAIRS